MEQRLSSWLAPFRAIATASAVWVILGVPVAAVIAAFSVFLWVITLIPEMAVTAAVLGAVQGFWLYLSGRTSASEQSDLRWLGALFGGVLGLLGFPPVFSRSEIVAGRLVVAVFLLAAVCGGVASGLASARVVTLPPRGRRSTLGPAVAAGCALLLPLAALDYRVYWPATADRLPVVRVSRQAVTDIPAGDARGSTWAGCYQYVGQLSRGSGILGGETGLLKVTQTDGLLKVLNGDAYPMLGGVDSNGRFRFGAQSIHGPDTLRELWEGRFKGNSVDYTKRVSLLNGTRFVNTIRVTGTGRRIPCNP